MNFYEMIMPVAFVVFIIAIGVVLLNLHFQKNLFKQKIEQETLKSIHQTELLRSSIYIQEEERKRIAQDLHDELGAVLSIVRMHLMVLEQEKNFDEKNIQKSIENIRQLSESALASVRNISHQLMPPQLEKFGLIKTIESVTEQINNIGKIQVYLIVLCNEPIVTWSISLGLYRIIMEFINNTIKHANAQNIHLTLQCNGKQISFNYKDDGSGFLKTIDNKGLGLKSIEGRITILNGKLEWGNLDNSKGFYANVQIPL